MNKNDLRWQRTEFQIKKAFIESLARRPFYQLTITDLIHRAKISRRAFYLHYVDKYDLLDNLEHDLLQQLQKALQLDHQNFIQTLTKRGALQHRRDLQHQTLATLEHVLEVIERERSLMRGLLSDHGDPRFVRQLRKLVARELHSRVKMYHAHLTQQIPQRYAEEIFVGQIIELTRSWLDNPHPESVARFAEILAASRLIAPLDLLISD